MYDRNYPYDPKADYMEGMDEVADIVRELDLPDFPDSEDDLDEPRELYLARFNEASITLKGDISLEDAQDYCSRGDTHGPGWFVGYRYQ